jgi:uncharacterized protein YkwD/DNA-binding beta-propeller fold protein YncE
MTAPFRWYLALVMSVAAVSIKGPMAAAQTVEMHQVEVITAEDPGPFRRAHKADLQRAARLIEEMTNTFRAKRGLDPVTSSRLLEEAATDFADYMARTGRYGPYADGWAPSERLERRGYDHCIAAENIAHEFKTDGFSSEKLAESIVTAWQQSPEHRRNMLLPAVVHTGVAVVQSKQTGVYFAVQEFGRPVSAAIRFQVVNRSEGTARYKLSEHEYLLPPRFTRTHTICQPEELTLLKGEETAEKLTPSDGDELTITGTQQALRVVVVGKDQEPKQHKIAVGGEGGWGDLTVDSAARRLYVARSDRVVVIDLDKETVVGELSDTPGVHGIALAPELGKGFTSNGADGTVTVFDLKSLKATGKIKGRGVPDAILYESVSKRVFTFNHGTNDATVIDGAGESIVGTILFDSEPEAAVADGKGRVFVNLRSTSRVAAIDAASLKVLHRWPLAPGVHPNGLGFDAKYDRLFSTCDNQRLVVLDANTGAVLSTAFIGQDSGGCVFDPGTERAYSSNDDGTITVVRETKTGKFAAVSTIPTQQGARTMALDPKTHRLYLPAATVAPSVDGAPAQPRHRNFVPGSFSIIVVGD